MSRPRPRREAANPRPVPPLADLDAVEVMGTPGLVDFAKLAAEAPPRDPDALPSPADLAPLLAAGMTGEAALARWQEAQRAVEAERQKREDRERDAAELAATEIPHRPPDCLTRWDYSPAPLAEFLARVVTRPAAKRGERAARKRFREFLFDHYAGEAPTETGRRLRRLQQDGIPDLDTWVKLGEAFTTWDREAKTRQLAAARLVAATRRK